MKCCYPQCNGQAARLPVAEIPTVRVNELGENIKTDVPTQIIGEAICLDHCKYYSLTHWFSDRDWRDMQGEAALRGFKLPDAALIHIVYRPLGWTPGRKFLEIER